LDNVKNIVDKNTKTKFEFVDRLLAELSKPWLLGIGTIAGCFGSGTKGRKKDKTN